MFVLTRQTTTDDFSDSRVGERLAQLVAEEEDGSLTALEVASKMHVSITLAQEFLKVRTFLSLSLPLSHVTHTFLL